MKILYAITKSEMGGAQTYVWHVLQYAKKNGDTAVVLAGGNGWLADKTRELGFEYIENPYFKNSFNPMNAIKALLFCRSQIKKITPDIVHGNSGAGGFFIRFASIGLPVKKIFTAHGWSFTDGVPFVRKQIARMVEIVITGCTDHILCVSENDARLAYKNLFGIKNKITVVHNGVPIPVLTAQPGHTDRIELLFVGRLTTPKIPITIIESLAQLPKDIQSIFSLRIAGNGEQESLLKTALEKYGLENQVVIKSVPTEQATQLYQSSDLFLLPTQWEGFPMTIVEAMACGLPVVASNVGGIAEAVDDTVGQLLTKGNEISELRALFEKIAIDKQWLTTRGHAARARAEKDFSAESMCKKIWTIYEQ
jgi:glycosyltransferase involved in cell wall biosynthesis